MTLAQIIARHEAAQARPIDDRTAGLTTKGGAVHLVYRLAHQLADLDADARRDVLHLLATEVRELPATD